MVPQKTYRSFSQRNGWMIKLHMPFKVLIRVLHIQCLAKPWSLLSLLPFSQPLSCYLSCHNSANPTEPVSFKFQLGPQWPVNESTERRKNSQCWVMPGVASWVGVRNAWSVNVIARMWKMKRWAPEQSERSKQALHKTSLWKMASLDH